jgi:hypothetical protein
MTARSEANRTPDTNAATCHGRSAFNPAFHSGHVGERCPFFQNTTDELATRTTSEAKASRATSSRGMALNGGHVGEAAICAA